MDLLLVCLFVVQYHELHFCCSCFCCCCFCCLLICLLFTSIVFFFGLLVFISITYLVALVIVVVDLLLLVVVDDVKRANVFGFWFFEGRGGVAS